MELAELISLLTMIVALILGFISKKVKWVNNNIIPLQNIIVGLLVAIIEWIITKDFSVAIALSGVFAGGIYDIGHNVKKLLNKGDE